MKQNKIVKILLILSIAPVCTWAQTGAPPDWSFEDPFRDGIEATPLSVPVLETLQAYLNQTRSQIAQATPEGPMICENSPASEVENLLQLTIQIIRNSYRVERSRELLPRIILNQTLELVYGRPSPMEGQGPVSAPVFSGTDIRDSLRCKMLFDSLRLAWSLIPEDASRVEADTLISNRNTNQIARLAYGRLDIAGQWMGQVAVQGNNAIELRGLLGIWRQWLLLMEHPSNRALTANALPWNRVRRALHEAQADRDRGLTQVAINRLLTLFSQIQQNGSN